MANKNFEIKINALKEDEITKKLKLDGKAQLFFSNELLKRSDKYTPMNQGILKNTARVDTDGSGIIYDTVYARYLWYGKVMIDPDYHIGAFHDPKTGRFWSRKGVQKIVSNRNLNFNGSPIRGSRWVERAFENERNEILSDLLDFMIGGKNG